MMIIYMMVLLAKTQDKPVYKTIILNKYTVNRENKNAFWIIIWSIKLLQRFMEVMKIRWVGRRLHWLTSMEMVLMNISTVLIEKIKEPIS